MAENKIYFNSGALFKVKEKKNEKAPDYRTQIQLDTETLNAIIESGGKISIAGWIRSGGSGQFVSLLVSADNYVPKEKSEPVRSSKSDEFEDEILF